MAKILRKTQKIFCENAATDQTAVFGTMKNIPGGGSATYSKDIETLQSDAAFLLGFSAAVVNGYAPFMEELNAILYAVTYQISYILQNGIPEWDDGTTYYIDSFVVGSNSKIYRCLTDDCINIDPTTDDGTNWYDFALNGANQDLSNLTETGVDRLHALKGYLENGTALSDTTLYNDVHSYANSTFDLSKFTVVGNPTITDNGIASGLSTSNYLTAIPSSMYYNKSNWHLQFQTYFDTTVNSTIDYCDFAGSTYSHIKYEYGWNSIALNIVDINDTNILLAIETIRDKLTTGNITIDIYYSSSTGYYFTATQNGITYTSSTSSNTNQIKNSSTNDLIYLDDATITFDLKTIKFFVDGYPVFNGNKTGEDVISSGSSYTIFGTGATVDSNNIASGFNQGSGIKYNINYAGNTYNTFELYLGEYELTTVNTAQWFYKNIKTENSIQSGFMIQFNGQNKLRFFGGSGTANNDIFNGQIGSVTHAQNAKVKVKLVFDGSNYTLYSSDNGGAWVEEYTKETTLKILFPTEVILGQDQSYFRGKINLNEIKTIIDGSIKFALIGLSIPYILSSTGSKIVDSAYRDSVIALYRQKGKALYYTIDYTNKNVTLPMGEVYGFIEENKKEIETKQTIGDWCITEPTTTSTATINKPAVIVENYINGKDGYRVWSDGFIEQWGYKATTANVAQEYTVSLLKTFSNTNYYFDRSPDWYTSTGAGLSSFFDNGYTLKSTTEVKFKMHESSAQNGTDWYACGY